MFRLRREKVIETHISGKYQLDLLSSGFTSLKRLGIEILRLPELASKRCDICLVPNRHTLTCTKHTPFIRYGLPATPKKIIGLGYYYYKRRFYFANVLTRQIFNSKQDPTHSEILPLLGISLGFLVRNTEKELDVVTFVPSFKSRSVLNQMISQSLSAYLGIPLVLPKEWLHDKHTDVGVINLPPSERRDFVADLFKAVTEEQIFKDQKVLLFDDILASGETLSRNAFLVRELGANQIIGAVLARTISMTPKKLIKSRWLNSMKTKSQKRTE